MKFRTLLSSMVLALFFLCASSSELLALIAFDQNYNFNFQFNNPGARANAMGGAFIGLADDATAVYTNPAGLTALKRPEISLEYKLTDYKGRQYDIDGDAYDYDEAGSGLSFVSLVIPRKQATFAVFRQQLLKLTSDYDLPQRSYSAETDIEATAFGIGVGFKIPSLKLSLGASGSFTRLSYYTASKVYTDQALTFPPRFKYLSDDEDSAEHYTVSLLWNPVGGLNLGLVYRQGPEFNTTFETLVDWNTVGEFESLLSAKNTFKVPDVLGFGVSWQFDSGLTVAADVNFISYSDLLEGFVRVNDETVYQNVDTADFTVDDQMEVHIGLEYLIALGDSFLALRAGYQNKPEHRIRYEGPNAVQRKLAQKGEDDTIYSFGAGTLFSGNIQLDAATRIGEFEQQYLVSLVYKFN